ncbi:MAG: ORF6N domain-containing protein [Bacteroidales bacterium]
MSKNDIVNPHPLNQEVRSSVFELRGYLVMLAADVAVIFNVETREIVQNIKRNNEGFRPIFPERYAFQINKQELAHLRSLGVISKPGRGGARTLPWVVTRKGAIRLATIMKVPTAMDAADVFVDVFDEVLGQVFQGEKMIQISNSSRIAPDEEQLNQARKVRSKIASAIGNLLNTVIDTDQNTTVKDELGDVAQEAVAYVKEWLRTKKVGNEKIEAETYLLLEKVRDMHERRQSELASAALERERKVLENLEKRIDIVERLLQMHNQLEPNAVVNMVGQYIKRPLKPSTLEH